MEACRRHRNANFAYGWPVPYLYNRVHSADGRAARDLDVCLALQILTHWVFRRLWEFFLPLEGDSFVVYLIALPVVIVLGCDQSAFLIAAGTVRRLREVNVHKISICKVVM